MCTTSIWSTGQGNGWKDFEVMTEIVSYMGRKEVEYFYTMDFKGSLSTLMDTTRRSSESERWMIKSMCKSVSNSTQTDKFQLRIRTYIWGLEYKESPNKVEEWKIREVKIKSQKNR